MKHCKNYSTNVWGHTTPQHSLCETRAHILHTQLSCLDMSLVPSPYMGKWRDLFPDFRFVGKAENLSFKQTRRCFLISLWSSSTSSNLSPSNRCYRKCSTVMLPNLLLNRWDVHHKMRIDFFSIFFTVHQRSVNWCQLTRQRGTQITTHEFAVSLPSPCRGIKPLFWAKRGDWNPSTWGNWSVSWSLELGHCAHL